MKKMIAKIFEISGLALVFAGAGLCDGGTSFSVVVFLVLLGTCTALISNFAVWKCKHPSRKPSVVQFRPQGAPALCGSVTAAMPPAVPMQNIG